MEAEQVHRRQYRLRYDDVDSRAIAKPVAILDLLEDAAASHCERAGLDVFSLMRRGFGWVLLRGGFEMVRYPRYLERIAIETWVSSWQRFRAEREYRIFSEEPGREGELLGSSRALWLYIDAEKRRPATIAPEYLECWKPGGSPAGALELAEVSGPPVEEDAPSFEVRCADIDTNGHVNNVVYLAWALEALPRETRWEPMQGGAA